MSHQHPFEQRTKKDTSVMQEEFWEEIAGFMTFMKDYAMPLTTE
jgi:hypothetical protein